MVTYIVREGDSIFSIAENFGVSESQLTSYNGLANQPGLVPGQAIIILSPDITATVQPGDSLDSIAAAYGTDLNSILDVYKRQIYGFLGPNGAGKSTTMNIITAVSYTHLLNL